MGRPHKKSKGKRKGNRHQTSDGDHNRQQPEEPVVCFDPDPPVADDDDDSPPVSDDDSPISDTVRVPEMALTCTCIKAIHLGAAALQEHIPPPPPPPRRPILQTIDEESHPTIMWYPGRTPSRRSRVMSTVPLNNIEPLVSYNRKMARIAPRSTIRTTQAQADRERAAQLCPCNHLDEVQL